ncbi:protein TFG-like isoform X2 [Mercenaria mercenaria]|uniref:protein TFG-like isoform X2 n=1 Tax=Mercenaria mercenaria TaxID=6596 RepID=UPI00234EA6CD|nr:protein TFG-like isoform X2 [Mercenaria mercenaria]
MNEPGIDLTGKLIIKVALGDDIRRILITNEDITYDELVLMMQRVYRGKLSSNDDIMIKYKDEDNDLITIFDSSDLNFAIQCSRILKITLFDTAVDTELNGKPEPLQTDEIKMIKSELKHIRERCNQLLDKLDDRQPYDASSTTVDSSSSKVVPPKISESPQRASPRPSAVPQTSQGGSKEFDPLSSQRSAGDQQNKVMSSFGISNDDRPGTPDSISSIGSSSSRQQQQQGPGVPTQQGGQAPYTAGSAPGSGQKIPPWQQQQPGTPTAYHQGPQEFSPALMSAQTFPAHIGRGQNTWAGIEGPHEFNSYQRSLMQSHTYTGHEHEQHESSTHTPSPHPSYAGGAQQPPQQQQQQHPGYPPQSSQPGTVQPPTSQYGQGYSQAGQTGAQPAAQPGQQQPGYQQQGYGMVMPPQQQQPLPSQQPQSQGAPGPVPQQQQQQQVPQGSPYGGYQQQAPQPGAGAAQGQGPPGSGNPYASHGPRYGAGYPRPAGNYPQGYQ